MHVTPLAPLFYETRDFQMSCGFFALNEHARRMRQFVHLDYFINLEYITNIFICNITQAFFSIPEHRRRMFIVGRKLSVILMPETGNMTSLQDPNCVHVSNSAGT